MFVIVIIKTMGCDTIRKLEGIYIQKKKAISVAQSLERRGFKNIAVIPVLKSKTTESQQWNNPHYSGKLVKMWRVSYDCISADLENSIFKLKEE